MKKHLSAVIAAALIGFGVMGCGSDTESGEPSVPVSEPATEVEPETSPPAEPAASEEVEQTEAPSEAQLTENGGELVDTDPEASALEGSGFDIAIDPAAGTAMFQHIDPATGDAFEEYSAFDFGSGTFERKVFVEAMGAAFVYTSDLATDELQSIENADGEDVSESIRERGRWDSAEQDSADQRAAVEEYFEGRYGQSVEQAATAS